jgi:Ca2+-binding EF-hand superfamily protein
MNTKVVAISTLAIGATALGGMLLMRSAPEETDTAPDRLASNTAKVQDSYFDSGLTGSDAERPERAEISTQNRSSNSTQDGRGGFGAMLDRATEFDADGDGILSDEERATMMRAMRDEWMARMDLDGDGELSREERMAARQAMFENSERGQALMRQFDADGDGVLNEEEQAAMEAYQQEQREQRRADELARYDADGDGQLSREERRTQREEQRQNWGDRMGEATIEFDRDGDGVLSIEESQEAYAVYQQRREIDQFVSQYDSDGNGSMGNADYSAFLSAYEQGNSHADVNRDGVVNSQDLAAYTDMVTRSRNRP